MTILWGIVFIIFIFPWSLIRLILFSQKKWICFDYEVGIYADFFVKIYAELLHRSPKYQLAVLVKPVSKNFRYDNRFLLAHYFPVRIYQLIKKKVVIHPTVITPPFLKNDPLGRHIQMNHGFGSFESVLDESYIRNVDMFFANTEHQVFQLTEGAYKGFIKPNRVKRVGYPKIDGPVADQVSIPAKVQAVFYGPTYHREISSVFDFLEPLCRYTYENKIRLYIKLHPLLALVYDLEKSGGIDWFKKIRELKKSFNNITLLPTNQSFTEIVKYFHESDVFITDNSGFGYEFVLITGKPIVFLGDKLKIPIQHADHPERYLELPEIKNRGLIGPVIKKGDDFETIMDHYFQERGLAEFQDCLTHFRSSFTFNVGHASSCACEAIEELIHDLVDQKV